MASCGRNIVWALPRHVRGMQEKRGVEEMTIEKKKTLDIWSSSLKKVNASPDPIFWNKEWVALSSLENATLNDLAELRGKPFQECTDSEEAWAERVLGWKNLLKFEERSTIWCADSTYSDKDDSEIGCGDCRNCRAKAIVEEIVREMEAKP